MKKALGVFLLATLTGSILFAAGGSQQATAGTKVINLWYWDQNADAVYDQLISEFQQQNPGVRVNKVLSPWADYWTKLQTALPTGTGPDVFWLNHPNAVSYLPTGYIMDLEGIAGDIRFENFNENFYKPFVYQNKRYGVPIFYDSIVLFYNKALFDKAGVAYPNANWTWADFRDAAAKLTIKDGNTTSQYGVIISSDPQDGFSNYVYQNGGKIFSDDHMKLALNSPEGREAIQFQLDLIHKEGFAPTVQEVAETSAATLFQSGIVAMYPDISANVSQFSEVLKQNLQIAPLPQQKQRASVYHNLAYVASAKTKYPEEVKKLITFLASRRHADVLSKVWPPCFTGTAQQFFAVYNWIDSKVVDDAVVYGYPLPIAGKNAGAVYTLMTNEMQKIFTNGQLGDSLTAYEATINAAINK
jgi:multiple sugar transport system substrate-binding protein